MSTSEKPDIKETPQTEALENESTMHNDFKDADIDLKTVKKFVIGSFGVTLAIFVLMLVVHSFYRKAFTGERGVAVAEERQIPGKDDALLQTQPLVDRQAYFDAEAEKMTMTTNAVDHAVIPVESAKKLMVQQQAFPTPRPKAEVSGLSPMVAPPGESGMDSQMTQTAPAEASTAPAPAAAAAAPQAAAPQAASMASASPRMVPKYPNPPDPQMVAMGKQIWDVQCMAACHTGKKGAIGPNIQKAFGTMRNLESGGPILMDEDYVINSMNNPMEHIAKGYMPVMMSFKEILSEKEKQSVAAYLRSEGKEIMVAAAEPETPAPASAAEPEPSVEEAVVAPAPVAPVQAPKNEAPTPSAPAPAPAAPAPAPAAPAPTPAPAPGPIFV